MRRMRRAKGESTPGGGEVRISGLNSSMNKGSGHLEARLNMLVMTLDTFPLCSNATIFSAKRAEFGLRRWPALQIARSDYRVKLHEDIVP